VSVTVIALRGVAVVVLTVNTGGGATVNVSAADVPPPGAGENTLTCAVEGDDTSAAAIAARSCVLLTNVVVRATPFQRTSEPFAKPLPFTMSVNALEPALIRAGLSDVTVGTGLTAADTVTVGLVAARV